MEKILQKEDLNYIADLSALIILVKLAKYISVKIKVGSRILTPQIEIIRNLTQASRNIQDNQQMNIKIYPFLQDFYQSIE